MSKEKEMRERSKESKEKEDTSSASARAREDELYEQLLAEAKRAIEIAGVKATPPDPRHFVTMATDIMGATKEFAISAYRELTRQVWCNTDGAPIRNWPFMLRSWMRGAEYYNAKQQLLSREAKQMKSKGADYATRGRRLTANQSCIVDYDLPV